MYYAQLRAFHAVAVHGGFSKAAESLGLTQPTLSDQVKKLERDFDVALFNRVRKRSTLTETGRRLFEITGSMLDMELQAIDLLSETAALRDGQLTIAADAPFHVLRVIGEFRRRYPSVSVALNIGNSEAIMAQLLEFRADIGVLASVPEDARLKVMTLRDDPLVAVVPVGHPWARAGAVDFGELQGQDVILRERGSTTRRLIEEEFQRRAMTPATLIEIEGRESVREAVAAGIGIGFVSEPEFGHDGRLAMVRLKGCELGMRESMVCLDARHATRAVTAFWEVAADGL